MKKIFYSVVVFVLVVLFLLPGSFAGAGTLGNESNIAKIWCDEYCAKNKGRCEFCSKDRNCGPKYEQIAEFGMAEKDRWFACTTAGALDDESRKNQSACEDWCEDNKPACAKCSPATGCGQGYKAMTTFKGTGQGKHWYACTRK